MSGTILPQAVQTFVDANGHPLAGGFVYMYIPNTTTFKNTYQDSNLVVLNTNPIVLDGSGQAIIWGTGAYRQQVYDVNMNLIWDQITEDSTAGLLGNMTDKIYTAGVDFTPGTTTQIALPTAPASSSNIWVYFNGVNQDDNQFIVSGVTLTFTAPIPVGITEVFVKIGSTVAIGVPGTGTVTDASINSSSILYGHVYSWVASKDYGAKGDGTTNDSAALLTANTTAFSQNKPLVIVPGTYLVGTNITFTANVYVFPGAVFKVPTGITLAFSGILEAPSSQQIFDATGTGLITVNPVTTPIGYPEWWGAQVNTPAFDCSIAINACIVACRVTQLQLADYYLATGHSVLMQTENRKLVGYGFYNAAVAGTVTNIFMSDGTTSVIVMGPNTVPATINDYMKGLELENIFVSRAVAPVISGGSIGVVNRWTLYSNTKYVKSAEHMVGFYYQNVVQCHNANLWAFRSTAGTGAGTDQFIGYQLQGTPIIGSGGNASLYMTECLAGLGGPAPVNTSTGYSLQTTCADTYIDKAEVSSFGVGMQFTLGTSTSLNFGAVDCLITNPVLDTCTLAGLFFNGTTEFGAITILGGYAALTPNGANVAAVYFNNSAASVKLVGFQCVMGTVTAIPGICAINASNIDSDCVITECSGASAITLAGVTNSSFNDKIVNNNIAGGGGGAVGGTFTSRNKYNVSVKGGPGAWAIGYNMTGAANNYNEWNCTGLNSTVVGTKLVLNGVTITTQGVPASNTTNFVSGVMV